MTIWTKRYGIMLANPYEEKRLARWNKPYIVQAKLNGERCRAEVDHAGSVKLVSSELNEFTCLPHLNKAIKALGFRSVELDGELYLHGLPFSEIHSIVSRRTNIHPDYYTMQYHIFDYVSDEAQIVRTDNTLNFPNNETIQLVPTYTAETHKEIFEILDELYALSYEGIIVREITPPYVRKRSTGMMKWKPAKKDTYEIIGTKEEHDQYGTPKSALGAILFRGEDGSVGSVGTGFSKLQRDELWRIRHDLPGLYVEINYQHLTKRRGVPRSSSFLRILNTITEEELW